MSLTAKCLDDLRIFVPPFRKRRVGRCNDGGYVICEGLEYDCFLSGGISNDISFEEQFLTLDPKLHCRAYDGTISQLPRENPRITFHRQNIGPHDNDRETNLTKQLESHVAVMIKMDIEGSEYGWASTLEDRHLLSIRQLVIELHNPFSKNRWELLSRLAETHWLVHFHPNNCGGVTNLFGVRIPKVFECTYIRKSDVVGSLELADDSIPTAIDQKNESKNRIFIYTAIRTIDGPAPELSLRRMLHRDSPNKLRSMFVPVLHSGHD